MIKQYDNFFQLLSEKEQSANKYMSAFYSHALGIQILRHSTVMRYYSGDKKEYLNYNPDNCNDMLTDEVVEGWIKENIRITLETGVFRFPGNNNSDASKELTRQFLSKNIISVIITDKKNQLFSLLNRNKSDEADISLSALLSLMNSSCDITSSMVSTFIESADFGLLLESIIAEDFDIDKVMGDDKYENLRKKIKDNLSDDLNTCMKAFSLLTPTKRIKSKQDETLTKLDKLPNSPVKVAANHCYKSLKKACDPGNLRINIEANALLLTLGTIRGEIRKKMRYDKIVKQIIRMTVKKCFRVDVEGNVDVSAESLNNLPKSIVKDAALKCYNSLNNTTTTSIKIPALNIENETIASTLSMFRFTTDQNQNKKKTKKTKKKYFKVISTRIISQWFAYTRNS